jgi:hypothetical protein
MSRRPVYRFVFVGLLLAVLLDLPAQASDLTGFLPTAGHGTVAFSYTSESYDHFWVGTTKVQEPALGEISTDSASLWLSWGLSDRLALIADVAHVDAEADGPAALSDSGLQDASVILAGRLWSRRHGNVEHSLVGGIGVRTALESYEANSPVARGDETTDGLLRIVYLLRSGRFYWSQQLGFDVRSDDAPNGIPLYTEVGWSTDRLTWIATYSRLIADGGTDIGDPGFTFPSNREEYSRLGAKLIGHLGTHPGDSRWSLFAGGFVTLDGRNVGDASGFSAGVIRTF